MSRPEKTVFISYRRTDISWALAVYQYLTQYDYDVFFDYKSIPSGDFEQIIIGNIKARAHFLVILTPTALDRCNEPGDWLRREIETAINEKRNIVPIFFDGFDFSDPSVSEKLTGKLAKLKKYNGLEVPVGFFEAAMDRLRQRFLNVTPEAVLHPMTDEVQKVVTEQKVAADQAISHGIESVESNERRLAKETTWKEKWIQASRTLLERIEKNVQLSFSRMSEVGKSWIQKVNFKRLGISSIVLLVILGLIFAGNYLIKNPLTPNIPADAELPVFVGLGTPTTQPTNASTVRPTSTVTPSETPSPTYTHTLTFTPTLGVGSTLISEKDGMTMIYVPAGNFEMGSQGGEPDERPIHSVYLDAYWIDQTEMTNSMYAKCVRVGVCSPPSKSISVTRDHYYGNSQFDDYPVIYVSWGAAMTYCDWAGRRLPSEAEWEKAAGWDADKQAQRLYPWEGTVFNGKKANFCDANCPLDQNNPNYNDGYADTAPVGSYPAGASYYGAFDMAGNVWEWVTDWYDVYPGGDENASDDFGQTHRVVRGGSWFFPHRDVFRAANRAQNKPDVPNDAIGFRCAMDAFE